MNTISLGYFIYIQVMSTNIADDQVVLDCAFYVWRDNDKFAVRPGPVLLWLHLTTKKVKEGELVNSFPGKSFLAPTNLLALFTVVRSII